MMKENEDFHSDIDKMFESYLKTGEKPLIRIMENGRILTKMNYSKVLFDADLRIYKRESNGSLVEVTDTRFKAVVISQ